MSLLLALLKKLMQLLGMRRSEPQPPDPDGVPALVRRSPPGRSGAVAVMEPDED